MRFTPPIANRVLTRGFDYLSSLYVLGQHAATDYIPEGRPATGEPIRVVADGTVAGVGWDFYSGYFVAVDHANGWRSIYRHLYGQTPVTINQWVVQGQIIGNVGNTGASLGAHLHLDLWNSIQWFDSTAFYKNSWWAHDPELYLGKEATTMTNEQFAAILTQIQDSMKFMEVASQVTRLNTQEQAANVMTWVQAVATVSRTWASDSDRREADRVIQSIQEQLAGLIVSGSGLTFEQTVEATEQGVRNAQQKAWV